ncbi:Membrane protein involved in the export of O-antigen and teichoic acid [Cryobacterium flavum]|uniref:Membrane protein involved in the export of O-antigen and teichoic acid n=1 Tax=Cryobacterium flavum TaxID=1424659 RepID=A0A5E9FXL8_9MICO|nr:Membrane protein involved in the export of O-antigen and teichoic acid [Cryobacterium flavum]
MALPRRSSLGIHSASKSGDATIRKHLRGAPVYLLSTVAQAAGPILLLPAQRIVLGVDDLGFAILSATIASFTGLFATMGVADAVVRRRLSGDISVHDAMRLVKFAPLAGAPVVLAAAIGMMFLAPLVAPNHVLALVAGAAGGLATCTLLICQQSLRADERAWSFLGNVALWHLVSPIIGLLLALSGLGFNGYIVGWSSALLGAALFAFLSATHRKTRGTHTERVGESYKSAVQLGLPVLLHALAGSAISLSDRTLLAGFSEGEDVAYFQAIYLFGLAPGIVLVAINNAWAIRLFKASDVGPWAPQHRDLAILAFIATGLSGVAIVLGKPAYELTIGTGMDTQLPIVAISLLASLALTQVLYLAGLNALYREGLTRMLVARTLPCALVQGSLSAFLIPHLGYLGPCIALFTLQLIQALVVWNLARRHTGMLRIPVEWYIASLPVWLAVGLIALLGVDYHAIVGILLVIVSLSGIALTIRFRHKNEVV